MTHPSYGLWLHLICDIKYVHLTFVLPFYCPSVYFYLCDLENSDFLLKLWYCMLVFHVSLQGTMKWNTVNYASSVHGSAFQIKRKRIESIELNTLQIQRFFWRVGGVLEGSNIYREAATQCPKIRGSSPQNTAHSCPQKKAYLPFRN